MTNDDLLRILVAVTETSPVAELWQAVLSRRGGATEVIALLVADDRWHRAASLPFTREISKLGGAVADFTRQRADELCRESVVRMHQRIAALAAEADLALAFEELSEQNAKRIEELVAGSGSILIASALITREPIYAYISRLGCHIELVGAAESDGDGH